ncbi:chromosome partitioning protein [Arthrobacter sp. MYb227]|uniref:TadE family type IV pilus minor pilin n=1 Tax=Arthrobacter sp. MYb227 TaxID=1848601 RepID=UPI000CFCD6C6|nr:TadE family type IV pilus minor pilin [Arthrobacter sp. MYb227]PQZ96298.1 chromosome partitioning protein [Arthrobacter sp. MYb227]
MQRPYESGSSTAETAVLLPAVALLLTLVVSAGAVGGEQIRIQQAASASARELARGTNTGDAMATAKRIGGNNVAVTLNSGARYAKVSVSAIIKIPLVGDIVLSAKASARKELSK